MSFLLSSIGLPIDHGDGSIIKGNSQGDIYAHLLAAGHLVLATNKIKDETNEAFAGRLAMTSARSVKSTAIILRRTCDSISVMATGRWWNAI